MESLAAQGGIEGSIDVLLVEDDAPTRERLCDALDAAREFIVTSAASVAEARTLIAQRMPRILLTDLRLPDGHGIELIQEVRQASPSTDIMVISILGDEESVMAAITAGATGYLLKDAFYTDVATTVRELAQGHSPISASIARYIVRRTQANGSAGVDTGRRPVLNTAKLTAREIDILWGIAKGFSYADIADHLGLSRQTVPGHIKNIYRKLEVNTRGEAVFEAVQQGLIRL